MKILFYAMLYALLPLSSMAAAPATLTLDEAMRLSLENQPHLMAQEAAVHSQTELRYVNSDDPKLKEFKFAIDLFRRKQEQLVEDISLLALGFLTVDERNNVRARRQRQIGHSITEINYLRSQITSAAGQAWLSLYYAQHATELLRGLQREYQNQIESANISYRAGKGSQQDIWKAQDLLNATRDREIELKGQAGRARAELVRWIGPKLQPLDEVIALPPVEPLEEINNKLIRHPAHQPYTFSEALARSELKISKEAYKPDPKIEYHPEELILTTMQALIDKIQLETADHLRILEMELASAYSEWQAMTERVALYEKSTVPNASRRLETTLIAYRNGKADLSAVLEARRNEIEARLQQLELKTSTAKARLRLSVYEQSY